MERRFLFHVPMPGGESTDRKQDKAVAIRHRDTPFVTKSLVVCHISGSSVPDIFLPVSFLYVCGRKT